MNKENHFTFPFSKQKFIRSSELLNKGLSYYMIHRFVKEGILAKINGNTYENLTYVGDESDYLYAYGYVNGGVVCLMSAAVFHGMSTTRTNQIDVAVRHKAKTGKLPEWPAIGIFYFDVARYETGIQTVDLAGGSIQIYDREKTVCDLLTYRNKYGIEDCLAVLKAYLRREERDINKLIAYSEKLKSYHILSKYLEVLL
ncbi:MAG: type IV toxin-antitoxin system AbiEi family antitoxin domain-containing protein [Candidatus Izemoplasmatales bacterium]|nr:type IV toxin-antitoxin system AbiEi family antitoxin domain-containing protein [Candidatus Izemoplasmatales bacterium]